MAMVRYARLTEFLVASSTVIRLPLPSALPGVRFSLRPLAPHEVDVFSFHGRLALPSTISWRLYLF